MHTHRFSCWPGLVLLTAGCSAGTTAGNTTAVRIGSVSAGLCAEPPDNELGRGVEENGPSFNGTNLVHAAIAGTSERAVADAHRITGLRVAHLCKGVTLRDQKVRYDVTLQGSQLAAGGAPGTDFVGALLWGVDTDGNSVRLRIDGLAQAGGGAGDLTMYTVSYQPSAGPDPTAAAATADWSPICQPGQAALALAGRWDYHRGQRGDGAKRSTSPAEVTFACQGSAIEKCVERLGYRPWQTFHGKDGVAVSGEQLHQACVRAVRADYCGDGMSLTRAGEAVNFYDAVGLQQDTKDWQLEAEWTADGARCVSDTRLLNAPGVAPPQTVRDFIADHCPTIWQVGDHPCLLDPKRSAALVWTEYQSRP